MTKRSLELLRSEFFYTTALGTVQNRPGQDSFRWRLELAAVGASWQTLITDQQTEKIEESLFGFPLPESSGAYQIRLIAENGYGKAQTTRTFYVSGEGAPDGDGDGFSDEREFELFGGLGETLGSDFDGDGMSNGEELKYGFDPVDGGCPGEKYSAP